MISLKGFFCLTLGVLLKLLQAPEILGFSTECDGEDENVYAVDLLDITVRVPVHGQIVDLYFMKMPMSEAHREKYNATY